MAVSTRQALLQALSAAGGSYVSGQQLAETLGVSRAAVHKAAAALTAQGYALEAAPRRGYRLAGGDPFCAEAIGDYPAPIYLYDTLESSNRTAKLLALDGAPHGTLVLTAHQSAGRGRLGRRFESPAGKGVYCSVLLRPEIPAANAQTATISAAVAVCRAVKKLCGLELAVKWVNDLYYQGRKVCGILTEAGTDLESGQLEWLVVGIGLNLTSTAADWPEELARKAGSLYPGGPAPVSRAALAGAIARAVRDAAPADVPVTVKLRIGWDADHLTGVEVAKQLEANGADLIAVHGRTREQMYIPPIDTAAIAAIKQAVSVPVLANGDVTTADEALTLLKATGCDGVMIGRGALGDPWLFAQVRAALLGEERPPEPTLNQRMTALRDQIYEMCEEKGEWAAMPQARSQAMHYMKGLHGAAALRRYCSMLEHFSDVDTLIEAVYRLQ